MTPILWWDTGDQTKNGSKPYPSIRKNSYNHEYDLLVCGGEDHKVDDPSGPLDEHRYTLLEQWTMERFLIREFIHIWMGEVLVAMDSIAHLGRNRFDKGNV